MFVKYNLEHIKNGKVTLEKEYQESDLKLIITSFEKDGYTGQILRALEIANENFHVTKTLSMKIELYDHENTEINVTHKNEKPIIKLLRL